MIGQAKNCGCRACLRERGDGTDVAGFGRLPAESNTFVTCDRCGSKRCPRATDHAHACTLSNDPGQLGSVYGQAVCSGCKMPGVCTKHQACACADPGPARFMVASLKHTNKHHEHITWWGPAWCGYTPVVGPNAGLYFTHEAQALNDGVSSIAVPVAAVMPLLSAEPLYKPGARFYDQRGPVVENTRENWRALIAASIAEGRQVQAPKFEVFRGTRRVINRDPAPVARMAEKVPA